MSIILLIPAILCIIALFRSSTQKAFLNVYIPVFVLCPLYFYWKVPSLPPMDATQTALVPLGIAMLLTQWPRWRFSVLDAGMVLFVFTGCYSDYLTGQTTIFVFSLFNVVTAAVIPYMAGKVLIEQNEARVATVKRIVVLIFAASVISIYEYRAGRNLFSLVFMRLLPSQPVLWFTQIRWGFGRVAGPYGQSELAGMMLFFGFVLTLWLGYYNLWEPRFKGLRSLPLKKSTIIAWGIGITLLMTQARGPWLGCLLAVPIAFIGRSKRVLYTAVRNLTICVVCGTAVFVGLNTYAASSHGRTEEQDSAHYRQELLTHYIPIAEQGGLFGWGGGFPRVSGQKSIDNEYLLITLVQGYLGVATFILLCIGTVFVLIRACVQAPSKRDQYFAFSMLGIFAGLLLTIATVFIGNQPYQLFFLLMGWAQALPTAPREHRGLVPGGAYA